MLNVEKVGYSYGEKEILYPDWKVSDTSEALILGGSGSGKTTLLHLIGGLMKVKRGHLSIAGEELSKMKNSELDRFRANNIGIIFQRPHLVKSLSVSENLLLAQKLAGGEKKTANVNETLDQLGILDLVKHKTHQLSQGQAQRVAIARAVLNKPKLLLADEPTASLDDDNCQKVITLLKDQSKVFDTTLIVATHDQRIKAEFKNHLSL